MAKIQIAFLWHMHQPFYKDLVTGEYRLPWVRLHALKDYYGMVRLLDEFPEIHQTFNLVPSLLVQLEDYVSGRARDPFLEVAAKPARSLSPEERRFALSYLFQANPVHMIARYPRYEELFNRFRGAGANAERALSRFDTQDFTDLQVLSQLAWFDEFFLAEPAAALVSQGRDFSEDDQREALRLQRELMAKTIPAYREAARRGAIEISTSPFYHPILPLLCDTDEGAVSSPGLKLPQQRFQHPEDAQAQLELGLGLHERVFGMRPRGVWPSEGSVSEPVLQIAQKVGVEWLATDEGVLGRSLGWSFHRDAHGLLSPPSAERLYRIYRYESGEWPLHLLFRDRVLSDLIGFVYSGMPAKEAADNFVQKVRALAHPVLAQGTDAIVPVFLDGENAWEYYPQSGREFLRRLYDAIQRDPQLQAVTVSEAIHEESQAERPSARPPSPPRPSSEATPGSPPERVPAVTVERRHFARLTSLLPGSWIDANFNVWIGAPEDNRSWDYLSAARDYYANYGLTASPEQRALAFEELLIAEGSDWNWWYGPEHHSANDRDFDELYRKHLSNVYLALGGRPPDCLAQPIAVLEARPTVAPQTGYIHPRVGAAYERYFDWVGAALYSADQRAGAMHGKQFLLHSIRAGIDELNLYGRLDFLTLPEEEFELRVNVERVSPENPTPAGALNLEVMIEEQAVTAWRLHEVESDRILAQPAQAGAASRILVALGRNFSFQLPLALLGATHGCSIRLRFALWRDRLPLDALPSEGWMELRICSEEELQAELYNYSAFS
jgi:alpha-amylase/alpha-mannosidase (GH57 family)